MNGGAEERRTSSISLLLSCTNQSIVPVFHWFYWEDWESWEETCLSVLFTWTCAARDDSELQQRLIELIPSTRVSGRRSGLTCSSSRWA